MPSLPDYKVHELRLKQQALSKPNDYQALKDYALVLTKHMQYPEALSICMRLSADACNDGEVLSALCTCCAQLGLPELAVPYLKRVPSNYMQAVLWVANQYTGLAMLDEVVKLLEQACVTYGNDLTVTQALGVAYMGAGQVALGLSKSPFVSTRESIYERRPEVVQAGWNPDTYWQGEDLTGKTVLLSPIMSGYGDYLQFCRYVKSIRALGASRVLGYAPAGGMNQLLLSCEGLELIDLSNPVDYDCWTENYALCAHFLPKEGFLSCDRYLTAPPVDVSVQSMLEVIEKNAAGRTLMGISWNSDASTVGTRNVPLSALLPLFGLPNVYWVVFQRGWACEEFCTSGLNQNAYVVPESISFDETAALVNALDRMVTTDSYLSHLAGAIGKPVYLMGSRALDWRHMNNETQSPWYPQTRIVRQPKIGDWRSVVDELCELCGSNE
ncbi:hypothetical protein DTO96_100352 [Ephemeroptericola cinctiostellae]|uniref:TPR repeat-containing protein n=1 Tax=Ephemeroptericola cinctiostellae TaxID=2268024 RepID=A0A345D8F4_9BURK|nr:hypothetical protein [Ephemeroptericola cinctiostellae]AXF84642.1 hypothetical protein DTO96_100352 [Ephemeroptericola cinctiostellae]